MKIGFICQYFLPEIGAPSARVSELAREWTAAGHDVTVITGFPNHPTGVLPPEYRGAIFRRERLGLVEVWRNWLFATPNEGLVKKTLGHLSFACSVGLLSGPRLSGFDVLIVSSPTFFVVITTYVLSRLRRVPYVFEVRDLWPGIFVELGVLKSRLLIRALEAIEMFLYRRAARVVVVTDSFARILVDRGVPAPKVVTVTNGVDVQMYRPESTDNDTRRQHALTGKFVVLYIGAHGISHGLSAVLDAAQRLAALHDVEFVFVGEGAEKNRLMSRARELSLGNVRFLPGVPKEQVSAWYAAADVVLVPLRNIPLFDTFIPSKMFEIMASGRPIVASVRGEARGILERSEAAIVVDPEDSDSIAAAIVRLRDAPASRKTMGEKGRAFVSEHYTRRALAARYLAVLEEVTGRRTTAAPLPRCEAV